MRTINSQKEFEDIIYAEQITLSKEAKSVDELPEGEKILLTFTTAPYEVLLDKLRKKVNVEETETKKSLLYMKYEDNDDVWGLGYFKMDLDFWKMIEEIFINYKPKFYRIEKEVLKKLEKIDYIGSVKLKGSELDGFIE